MLDWTVWLIGGSVLECYAKFRSEEMDRSTEEVFRDIAPGSLRARKGDGGLVG